MRKLHHRIRNASVMIIVSLLIMASFPMNAYALKDAIIAIVNDEVITLKDLKENLRTIYIQLISQSVSQEEIETTLKEYEEKGLKKLIQAKLMISEADRQGLEIREKAVDKRMDDIKSKYPSEKFFLESLIAEGITLTELRKKILEQMKIQYIIETEVTSKVLVKPQEITQYYEQNKDKFHMPQQVDLDSIFIPYNQNKATARTMAAAALDLLKNNKDFNEVREQYSQSSSIGLITKGQMIPLIEEIVFDLTEGEISSFVEVDEGIYLFKAKEIIPPQTTPLEEAKKQIHDFLYQEKYRNRFNNWLSDLEDQAYVEIKE